MGEPKISLRSKHLDLRLAKFNEDALHTLKSKLTISFGIYLTTTQKIKLTPSGKEKK